MSTQTTTTTTAADFKATNLGAALMEKANEVVSFQVQAGEVEDTREAKMSYYGVVLEMLIEKFAPSAA